MSELAESHPDLEPIIHWVTQFVAERERTFAELDEAGCPPVAALAFISFLLTGSISILLRQDLNDQEALAAVRAVGASTFDGSLGDRLFKPHDGPREPRFGEDLETIAAFRERCEDSPVEESAEIFTVILSDPDGYSLPREEAFSALAEVGERFFVGMKAAIAAAWRQ